MAAPASPTKGKSPSRGGVAALRTKFGGWWFIQNE
jgi:hypothetical protein